mmetsp:Transcript_8382/g.25193  ORF Transcript_8382/g.25193 Transcript_8382/m.25193 type:complete len:1049 (-) Transcript_8382:32-3178(-)
MDKGGFTRRFAEEVEDAIAVSSWGTAVCASGGECFLAAAGSGFVLDFNSGAVKRTVKLPRAERVKVAMGGTMLAVGTGAGLVRVYDQDRFHDMYIPDGANVEEICMIGEHAVGVVDAKSGFGVITFDSSGPLWDSLDGGGRSESTVERFFSSISSNFRRDNRTGPLLTIFAVKVDSVIMVRAGGSVEKWAISESTKKSRKPHWEWNIASAAWERIAPRSQAISTFYEVIGAKAIEDGRMCALLAFSFDSGPARLFVVTADVSPLITAPSLELVIEVGTWGREGQLEGSLASVSLALSAGVAYVIFGDENRAAFVSISRGISVANQIYGEVGFYVPEGDSVIHTVDAGGDELQGGSVAILFRERFGVITAGVPAPSPEGPISSEAAVPGAEKPRSNLQRQGGKSKQTQKSSTDADSGSDFLGKVWRAYLQFASNQIGAARVTLRPVSSAYQARGNTAARAISGAIVAASERILNSGSQEDDSAPSSLLVNHTLQEKQSKHGPLLKMLKDKQLMPFTIWEVLGPDEKAKIVGNAGRLLAANMVRSVENAHSRDEKMPGISMIISEALRRAKTSVDPYREVTKFERILPALQQVFEEVIGSVIEGYEDDSVHMTSIGETALVALGGALAALSAGIEARNELLADDEEGLDDKGGWPCSEESISTARALIYGAMKIAPGCSNLLRDALYSSTGDLIDVMLAAVKQREGWKSSTFAVLRSAILGQLRLHDQNKTLMLSEKYRDFHLLIEMTCDTEEFEPLFEKWAEKFGDEFTSFAFQWMEKNGKMRILLEPRGGQLGRSQARYFSGTKTNLRWIQLLGREDFGGAFRIALQQGKKIWDKAGPNSLQHVKTLSSFAKLSQLCANEADEGGNFAAEIERRLYLIRAQEDIAPDERAVLPVDILVKRCLERGKEDAHSAAVKVVIALEIVKKAELSSSEAGQLRDYIWKQSIVTEADTWSDIAEHASSGSISDDRLAERLASTVFYEAACNLSLRPEEAAIMMSRGVFSSLNIGEEDLLHRLIRTTVDLANRSPQHHGSNKQDVLMADAEAAAVH